MNALVAAAALPLLEVWTQQRDHLPGAASQTWRALRRAASEQFTRLGLPTQRDEEWKYTSLAAIAKGEFRLDADEGVECTAAQIAALAIKGCARLVFVDGLYAPRWSDRAALPAAVTVVSLGEMLAREPDRLAAALSALPLAERGALDALNLACVRDGAYVELAPDSDLEVPLHLLFITRSARLAVHPRNLIVAGAGSRATIIEHHVGDAADAYWTNCVTELRLGAGARITHHKLQQESGKALHVAQVRAELGTGAEFASTSLSFGAALARVGIDVVLQGGNAACALDGLYLGDKRQHVDHHTRVDHASGQCTSREFYKGIVGGAARAVFNGKVVVHADAQHSDAAQENRNLLLSDEAEVDSKPQLEIWADDVKCSHAATVGQLDAEQVFYLRSRGIAEAVARALLTEGFAAEVTARIGFAPLRERVDRLLRERYGAAP